MEVSDLISLLILSAFWCVYGILGLFGVQRIPNRYRGTELEAEYKRFQGIGWLLLGIPWLVLWLFAHNVEIENLMLFMLMLAGLALPSLIYDFVGDRIYRKKLKGC